MVTSESTVCPGGSKVTEYRFGLQVIATKSIRLRFVILARATVGLVCFFSIQAFFAPSDPKQTSFRLQQRNVMQ